eukprot:239469-Amphidinium_carterae.1
MCSVRLLSPEQKGVCPCCVAIVVSGESYPVGCNRASCAKVLAAVKARATRLGAAMLLRWKCKWK